jgi:hypothetical protein
MQNMKGMCMRLTLLRTQDLTPRPSRCRNARGALIFGLLLLTFFLAACDSAGPTLTPTRAISGPTLAASPTVQIFTSEELYGTSVAFGGPGQNNLTAAPLPSRGGLPPVMRATAVGDLPAQIEIFLADQTSVIGDLYSSGDALMRGPGLLLIGAEGALWGTMASQARAAGITVLVIPLRPVPEITDMNTLLTALSELPTVDPSRLGVVIQGWSTELLFPLCAQQPLCDFAVLIGPQDQGILLGGLINYQSRPLLVVAGENDAESMAAAVALNTTAPEGTSRLITRPVVDANLLVNDSALVTDIVAWVSTALGAVPNALPTLEHQ